MINKSTPILQLTILNSQSLFWNPKKKPILNSKTLKQAIVEWMRKKRIN